MKQKLFTLLTLLLAVCSGAWAQVTIGITNTTTTTKQTATTETLNGDGTNVTVSKLALSTSSKALSEYTKGDRAMKDGSSTDVYSTHAYKWNTNTGTTIDLSKWPNEYVGFSFTVAEGKTFSVSGISAKLASSADHVFRIVIENTSGTTLYASTDKTINRTSDNELTVSNITTATVQNLSAGTYNVKAYLAFNSTSKYLVFTKLQVTGTVGTASIDTESPSITTDLSEETYNAVVGKPLNLSISASHANGYRWYSNTSKSMEGATAIDGATASTYTYTPTEATTKYFYCIATNSNATGTSTATSKIATVTSTASNDATVSSVAVTANGLYEATASGTAYTATIGGTTSASVKITPNEETAVVSCGSTTGSVGAAITVSATAGTQLEFSVTAGDGTTTVNYTLDITKAADKTATNNAYYLAEDEAVYGGQQIIGDDITMTFSNATNGTFAKANSDSFLSGHNSNFVASTAGNGQNGSASGISGTWYEFSPTVPGTLTVGAIVNDGKTLYIYKNNKNTKITSGVTCWAYGDATLNSDLKASGKVYGLITIDVEAGQNYYFSVGGSKMGFYGFEFTPATATITTNAGGWASFCPKWNATLSEGATAYIITAVNENSVTAEEVSVLKAGEGYFVNGATASYIATATSDTATPTNGNLLVGTLENITISATDPNNNVKYVLGTATSGDDEGKSGLFKVDSSVNVAAGKAYLDTKSESALFARFLAFDFGKESTGISATLMNSEKVNSEVYNLNGQRVMNPTKGLYIVNGRKVVIK